MDNSDLLIYLLLFAATAGWLWHAQRARTAERQAAERQAVTVARDLVHRAIDALDEAPFAVSGDPLATLRAGMSGIDVQVANQPTVAAAAARRVRLAAEYLTAQMVVAGGRVRGGLSGELDDEATAALARLIAGEGSFADVAALTADLRAPVDPALRETWRSDDGSGSAVFWLPEQRDTPTE